MQSGASAIAVPKGKAKCKAKAKAGAAGSGVKEESAKGVDDIRAELRFSPSCWKVWIVCFKINIVVSNVVKYLFSLVLLWGSALKKDINGINAILMDLPKDNPLRVNLNSYKERFEEFIDEQLGSKLQFCKF